MRNMSVPNKASMLALAIALAAGPSPAAAQSLQGTPTVSSGSANVSEGSGTTTVTVDTSQTVIDWDPDDNAVGNFGAINFQPSGTTATFQNNVDLVGDFAVLNRIGVADQTRIVALNGTINSLVNGQTGGFVYFYSPSGFVITGTAVINVGSLVLSASPITVDGNGSFINGGTVQFGQAPNPSAAINTVSDINGTAQINSSGSGSYVALVAPRIQHQGDIRTDGTAALVAAEAATINFSPDGLFNIAVAVGTDDANGIAIDGGTIGRNSAVEGVNNHRAYLVAVAKNDALTMVINNGGSVGFDTATSAAVENNVVVLSGGYDVLAGDHWTTSGVSNVSTTITNATLSSDVDAQVTGGAAINSGDGALTFGGDLSIISGETTTTGGSALVDGLNGNALTIAGNLSVRAFRRNADGSQTGLISRLGAQTGSTVTIGGDVTLDSDSFGAAAEDFGLSGTNAIGGNAQINIGANSTLNVAGSVAIHADGYGGQNFFGGGAGGNGIGGQALVMAINGNSTVDIDGSVYVSAQGFGGSAGECSICDVTGGNGVGGNASVHTNVGSGNSMTLGSDVTIIAAGWGGAGDAAAGGGFGGIANLGASDSSTLTVAADADVDASGFGGFGFDNVGGLGRGGEARIGTDSNGSIELTGPALVSADGEGGSASGTGGTGTGGRAFFNAFNGTIHAFDNVAVFANSIGGAVFGLNGTGGSGIANVNLNDPAHTWAGAGAENGTLTVDGIMVVAANATGGDGSTGGNGGNAVAGRATVHAGNSDSGPSVVDLGDLFLTAEAQGGAGGDGQGGTNGQDAGDGGSATGGRAIATAAAGNGELNVNVAAVSASATGGDGGSGGSGDGGDGGNGGDGGTATGGFINVGTESGGDSALATNDGVATFATIVALATASAGNGGDGGFGNIAGLGGIGGDAFGGNSVLLVRGSEVTVGNVNLDASAFGGNGGLSPAAPNGDGGDGTAGVIGVVVTNRNALPLQRGTLFAGDIIGTAIASGGIGGLADGLSLTAGGSLFGVLNSDATINSIALVTQADAFDSGSPSASPSYIEVQNGSVDIAGGFLFQTPGSIAMWADGGSLTAGTITVVGDNFIHDDTQPTPATFGTFSADTFNLVTGQDLIIDGHLISTSSLSLFAPGLIDIEDATSGGDLSLQAGDTISGGTQSAAGFVTAFAVGNITLGNVNAGSSIDIESSDGDISLAFLSAATTIDLDAPGDIGFADVTADDFDFDAGGDVNGGDIIAGTEAGGDAGGAITLGDINVGIVQAGGPAEQGFAVGITSATSISVGDVDADEAIGFATLGNLNTGDLNAGTDVMTLIGGDTTIASITTPNTGRTYHGDVQMFIDAGGPDDFDPSLIFGATPVRSGGFYNVAGSISTGRIQVGAASITTGDILAPLGIYLDSANGTATGDLSTNNGLEAFSGGSIATGDLLFGFADIQAGGDIITGVMTGPGSANLDAAQNINVGGDADVGELTATAAGNVALANVTSAESIHLDAGGTISGANLTAGDGIIAYGGGGVALGNLSAGIVNPSIEPIDDYAVKIGSDASVDVGNVEAAGLVGLFSVGALDAGVIQSDDHVLLLADGPVNIGAITSNAEGRTYIAGFGMLGVGGGFADFDPGQVFASANPIATTGNVTVSGSIQTGQLDAFVGGNLTLGPVIAFAINGRVGGLASINGLWDADEVELWSNDIEIAANGGIDAGVDGNIRLVSTNATQALIGDGLTGTGYALSNAEFGRLSAGNLQIAARGDASAAIDMLIGDLDVTGPSAGSTLEDPFGALVFATGDPATETAGGVIRITGDLTATGFADTNAIEFYASRFELDAATGLLEITGTGPDLSGELYIEADRIHVVEGAILDQLAANPQYDGYQDELNAPAAVQRPDGVIRAGGIDVFPTEAVLVQNMGTADTPAGFLTFGEGPLFSQSEPPVGPIELIINGQLITEGGTLTGVGVRDFLVDESNIGLFTESSTINGCLLTGPCGVVEPPEPPFPPGFTPTPGIQEEITLIDDGLLPPPDFGNEDFIDDNIETTAEGATSPISPPNPLFDSSALGGKGDVDDPVSGSGNPSLMEAGGSSRSGDGTKPAPPTCPADGSQPAGQCKQEKQP